MNFYDKNIIYNILIIKSRMMPLHQPYFVEVFFFQFHMGHMILKEN